MAGTIFGLAVSPNVQRYLLLTPSLFLFSFPPPHYFIMYISLLYYKIKTLILLLRAVVVAKYVKSALKLSTVSIFDGSNKTEAYFARNVSSNNNNYYKIPSILF
jgi:hypothetical protein